MATTSEIDTVETPLHGMRAQLILQHERVERLKYELEEATRVTQTSNANYRKSLIRYAKADCLQLTKMMHEKLPRELRDLVYHHLLVDERPIPVGPYYHLRQYDGDLRRPLRVIAPPVEKEPVSDVDSDVEEITVEEEGIILPDGRVKHDHSHKPPSDMVMPNSHVLNPRYVGQAFMIEAQEKYYTTNTFSICTLGTAIGDFLDTHTGYNFQKWGSRRPSRDKLPEDLKLPLFIPAEWIRNLEIRVKLEHFEMDMLEGANEDAAVIYERGFLQTLDKSISMLTKSMAMSKQAELNIEFILLTELPKLEIRPRQKRLFVNSLQVLRRPVYTAIHDREGTTIKVTHHDEKKWAFPRNLTGLFALTKEQWEEEKAVVGTRRTDIFYLTPPIGIPGIIPGRELMPLLRDRWGVDSLLATTSQYPITESKYWPRAPGWTELSMFAEY